MKCTLNFFVGKGYIMKTDNKESLIQPYDPVRANIFPTG